MAKQLLMHGRIARIVQHTETLRGITVAPQWRESFPRYAGGAHINFRIPDGRMRQYSLCGDPNYSGYRIAVRREDDGRGVSRYLHDTLTVGDEVHVSYPQERFRISRSARYHRFLAGGVGITPIVGMLLDLVRSGMGPRAVLHYLVHNEADAIFADELRSLGLHVDVYPSVRERRASLIEELVSSPRSGECLYICGPAGMLTTSLRCAEAWQWDEVRYESFAKPPEKGQVLGESFSVHLASADRVIEVGERETLLAALLDAGVPVQSACEGGVCATCVVDLAGGSAIHNDTCLNPEQREALIATCVSRGKGQLRLNL